MIDKLRTWYNELRPNSKEANMVLEMTDALEQAHELFVQGIAAASKNRQNAKNTTDEGGVKFEIRYPQYSSDELKANMKQLASMKSVYDVPADKLEKTGKKPSELFDEFFDSMNNNIYSDEFGDIELLHSSTKSEIRHGITAEKLASIDAIPAVITKGKTVFYKESYKGDTDRIVICAPITINNNPYYMGVMLQRDKNTQRLYLHNVAIEKDTADISDADLVTTGASKNNDHILFTSILQEALAVKYQKKIKDLKKSKSQSRDADYLSAVNRGDMETAQRMVDEVAKATQIKSADPVTYDDNGEVILLSERFNDEQKDIRYSERFTDLDDDEFWLSEEATDTELLAHHLEESPDAIGKTEVFHVKHLQNKTPQKLCGVIC